MERDEQTVYEIKFWQIFRYHKDDIKLHIEVTPDFGVLFYRCKMTLCGTVYTSEGKNLWKRYKEFTEMLAELYGENAYKYNKKPIK